MLDRASTFADSVILDLLKTRFVPVAIDQAYQRRQQDDEGAFYRKIAGQGPRHDFRNTTQGFYVATAAGELLLYNNNRDPKKVRRLVQDALRRFEASERAAATTAPIESIHVDPRWNPRPARDVCVVRVHGKILAGYEPTNDPWRAMLQAAVSRDNLWIRSDEQAALLRGTFPTSLAHRIARFHLVDATRGEPPMWTVDEVRELEAVLRDGRTEGRVVLRSLDGERSFDARWLGRIETNAERLTRFDLVVLGTFRGEGTYTRGAPKGDFALGLTFTLADGRDVADAIPPQGSRGWVEGYLR